MVTYFRQLRADGRSMTETVRLGAERRLRPVLMTASTTAFGLLPLLFATGPGSEILLPLATFAFAGLITPTLLTPIMLSPLSDRFVEPAGNITNARHPAALSFHLAYLPDGTCRS